MKTPAKLADGDHNELQYMAKDVQTMMNNPKVFHLGGEMYTNMCQDCMVPIISKCGPPRTRTKIIFDLIKISDLAYTVLVIENSHEIWEQCNEGQNVSSKVGRERWERDQEESSTKKTPKLTKRAGKKREYNMSRWNHERIHFFNKVCNEWKKQASKNKEGTWERLEAEWNEYIEDNDSFYFYGRSRKRKLNYSTDSEEMPPLPPPMQALEIRLNDDDDFMPDCPWKQHEFHYDPPSGQYINRVSLGDNNLNSV
jgi:hypothetical protein